MRSHEFLHNGKIHEVRAERTATGWSIRVFLDGIPAIGWSYEVREETTRDAANSPVPQDIVENLMKTAELDVSRNLASELRQAGNETDEEIAARINKQGM